jgi:plastocyanin
MEGRGSAAVMAVVAILVLAMAPGALAVNHVVGGTSLWTYAPANDLTYYDGTWAAGQTFTVGDTLQFEYASGQHDVEQLGTKTDYDACSGTAVKTYSSGNDTVPLPTAGVYYFICSFLGHCTQGMKVSVTVGAAVAPATPPTATPSPPASNTPPSTSTPPPPATTSPGTGAASSGPVLSMAGLFVAALVATLAFLV